MPCHDEAANHQLPIAVALWIILIVSVEESSSLMQNLIQIHCSTHSVILNETATQYTCSLNGIYHPHWLVSCHCSCMSIPGHSPWLPGYINATYTVLILIMAGLFPDRPHLSCIYIHSYTHIYERAFINACRHTDTEINIDVCACMGSHTYIDFLALAIERS